MFQMWSSWSQCTHLRYAFAPPFWLFAPTILRMLLTTIPFYVIVDKPFYEVVKCNSWYISQKHFGWGENYQIFIFIFVIPRRLYLTSINITHFSYLVLHNNNQITWQAYLFQQGIVVSVIGKEDINILHFIAYVTHKLYL